MQFLNPLYLLGWVITLLLDAAIMMVPIMIVGGIAAYLVGGIVEAVRDRNRPS